MYKAAGSILDNEMGLIPNANILELGTNNSVQADESGRFTIYVAGPDSQLRISHAGFDFDTVDAGYFEDMSYYQLYPTSLDDIEIINTYKTDYTLWWVAAGITAAIIVANALKGETKKEPRKIDL